VVKVFLYQILCYLCIVQLIITNMKNREFAAAVNAKAAHLREIKREASQRCRARQKAILNGELFTPELALRSLQPKAIKVENFKMEIGNKTIRLNRNGGTAVAMITAEKTESGTVKTRKSFKDIQTAVREFMTVTSTVATA